MEVVQDKLKCRTCVNVEVERDASSQHNATQEETNNGNV